MLSCVEPFFIFTYVCFFSVSITEAVPKKILDLMNIEGLTRENVASHLQVLNWPLPLANTVLSWMVRNDSTCFFCGIVFRSTDYT